MVTDVCTVTGKIRRRTTIVKKQEFIDKLKDASSTLDESWIKDVLNDAIITSDIDGKTKKDSHHCNGRTFGTYKRDFKISSW